MISLVLHLAIAAAQTGTLAGYVFRETDGNPPRRQMSVELSDGEKVRYRRTTETSGRFVFPRVQAGNYTLRVRFGEFKAAEDQVEVAGGGNDFAAVMLPKRRIRAQDFRAVTAEQLASQSNRSLQKSLQKAAGLVARDDLAGAARVYEQAAAVDATADLWDMLGLLYLRMGRKDEAIRAFERAIGKDPDYLLPYSHLGWFYQEDQRYGELLQLANRALAADPEWMTGHVFLGEARAGLGDPAAAMQSLQKAVALVQGKAPGPYLLMAKIQYLNRDCAGARKDLERYLDLKTSARALPGTVKLQELLRVCQ